MPAVHARADTRAQQFGYIFVEYAGESPNPAAKALNARGLPSGARRQVDGVFGHQRPRPPRAVS